MLMAVRSGHHNSHSKHRNWATFTTNICHSPGGWKYKFKVLVGLGPSEDSLARRRLLSAGAPVGGLSSVQLGLP